MFRISSSFSLECESIPASASSNYETYPRNSKTVFQVRQLYRLHFALDIFKMQSLEHLITSNEVGEHLGNFTMRPGYLLIADRAYSTINSMRHCAEGGAQYIFRLRKNGFTARDEQGDKIDFIKIFSALNKGACADIAAFATNASGENIPVRICAIRKPDDAILRTQDKFRRTETKKQYKMSDEAKMFNEYLVVATNVGTDVPAKDVLEAYRLRWQVEIYFKRLKSIFNFGEMPKRRAGSVTAWLNGKIMIALLIEIVLAEASFFPKRQI